MKISLFFVLMIINFLFIEKSSNLKLAICTIANKDNFYIKEFVYYYLKLGIDHIFIYEYNNTETKKLLDHIDKSIIKNHITIFENKTEALKNQFSIYTTCFNNYKNNFDWIFMFDINDYLVIINDTLRNYLSKQKYKEGDIINIYSLLEKDNILNNKGRLLKRFQRDYLKNTHIRMIVRGNIEHFQYDIYSSFQSTLNNITCNNKGHKYNYNNNSFNVVFEVNYDKAYIINFKFRTNEEYINWFDNYYKGNEIINSRKKSIEKELELNLSEKKLFSSMNKTNEKSSFILNISNQSNNSLFKRNLVIGAIANYDWAVIKPFFESFKNVKFENCDCVIFFTNILPETINKIKSFGVIIHEIPKKFQNMKIINYRWKIYEDFLKNNLDKYYLVFTADLRDTIFQKNIFKFYEKKKSFLGVAIEDGTISSEFQNKAWLIKAYGKELYKTIENEKIICVGTIWGTADKFLEFSKIMWEKLSSDWSLKNSVVEQAVCNYIIYHDKMFNDCLIKSENKDGPVMTIALTKRENINLDLDNNILNERGEIASVIHQYDRKLDIVAKIRRKYSSK